MQSKASYLHIMVKKVSEVIYKIGKEILTHSALLESALFINIAAL